MFIGASEGRAAGLRTHRAPRGRTGPEPAFLSRRVRRPAARDPNVPLNVTFTGINSLSHSAISRLGRNGKLGLVTPLAAAHFVQSRPSGGRPPPSSCAGQPHPPPETALAPPEPHGPIIYVMLRDGLQPSRLSSVCQFKPQLEQSVKDCNRQEKACGHRGTPDEIAPPRAADKRPDQERQCRSKRNS